VNSDIRLSVSFKGHRKRLRLEAALGPGAVGNLIDLWISAAQDRPDGVLTGWDASDVALAGGWKDEPEKFVDALLSCKFLDRDDETYRLHDWAEHQPWVCGAEERSVRARYAAEAAWRKRRECSEHADGMRDASGEQCSAHAPLLSSPILSSPLPSSPEERKREINKEKERNESDRDNEKYVRGKYAKAVRR